MLGDGPLVVAKQATGEPFRDLVVLDLESGATERLGYAPDHLVTAAHGGATAASVFTRDCILYPDRQPETCHAQIWALVAGSADGDVRTVAKAHQPVLPRWVGEDGAVLAYGGFYDGEPPERAPAEDPEPAWTLRLWGADGTLRATWADDAVQVVAARGGAVLVVVLEDEARVRRLERVDVASGATAVLARGRDLAVAIDPSGERLAWAARAEDDASASGPRALMAGAGVLLQEGVAD